MNISALKKDKNKLIIAVFAVVVTASAAGYFLLQPSDEAEVSMDFSKAGANKTKLQSKAYKSNKSNRIIKPDPAYKTAPEFEDYQAVGKMFVHAMEPYKAETKAWLESIVSLRHQREKIKLFQDASEAAKGEAEMYKYKNQTASFKAGKLFLDDNSSSARDSNGSDDIMNIENISVDDKQSIGAQYTLSSVRINLFAPGNKYSESSASFILGDERFYTVKVNQVFASQFLVVELDDDSFCAKVKDLNNDSESRVCRN
jgi:hypothetical protein